MGITKQDKERDKNIKKLQKYLRTIEESYISLYDNGAEIPEKRGIICNLKLKLI